MKLTADLIRSAADSLNEQDARQDYAPVRYEVMDGNGAGYRTPVVVFDRPDDGFTWLPVTQFAISVTAQLIAEIAFQVAESAMDQDLLADDVRDDLETLVGDVHRTRVEERGRSIAVYFPGVKA